MKSSLRSIRFALVVVGSLGAASMMNGCGAGPDGAEETGDSKQATTIIRIPPLREISAETGIADPYAGNACVSYTVSVPPTLPAQYNCTLGALYGSFSGPYAGGDLGSWSYAFACEAGIVGHLPAGLGMPVPSELDGVNVISESLFTKTGIQNSCFGSADSGWVIVIDTFYQTPITGGCVGTACDSGFKGHLN